MYECFCKTQPSNWINVLHALQKPSHNKNETNVLNIKLKNYPAVLTIDDKIVIPCNTKPKANKNAMTVKASHTQNLCLLPLTQWNVRFLLEKSVPSPSQSNPCLCSICWKELAPTKLQSNPEWSPVKKQHRRSYQKRICESTEPPEIIQQLNLLPSFKDNDNSPCE